MARFPIKEAEVFALAQEMLSGFAAYKIQRRERPEGAWADVCMSIESEITLSG